MQVILLKAKSYDFTNKQTGQQVSGFRFTYIPYQMSPEQGALGVPYVIEKTCNSLSLFSVLASSPVPGIFDVNFESSYNRQGNIVERPSGFKFVRPLDIKDFSKA